MITGPAVTPRRPGRRAALRAATVVIAACAAVAVAAGVGSGGNRRPGAPADPAPTSTSLASPVTVKVGFLGAGSGAGAALSRTVEDAERLAISQFTSIHAGIDVIVDARLTDGTAAGAARAARRLVADGVVAVIGPQSPAEVGAALPILSGAGIPALTATATTPELAQSGWTSFFRMIADDPQQGVDEADELVSTLHVTDLDVLAGDDGTDQTVATWVTSQATLLGAAVAPASSVTTAAAADVAARRAVSGGFGGVYFVGSAPVARSLVTALAGDGYQGVVLLSSDAPAVVLRSLGIAADGVYVASPADDPAAAAAVGGKALVFVDAYRAAFGIEPPTWGAEAYDAAEVVLQAVQAGATTGPTIAVYLYNHTSAGVGAAVSFASNGNQVDPPVFVSQIQNGAPVPAATATATPPSG